MVNNTILTESIRSLAKSIRSSSQNIWSIIWNYTIFRGINFRSAEAWLSVPEMNLTFIRVFLYQSVAVENDTIIKYWVCKIPFVRIFLSEPIFKVQTLQIFFFVISEIWFFSNSKSSKSKIQKIRKNSSPASKTFVVYFLSYAAYSIPLWFQSRKIFISRRGARFARNWSIFLSFINKRLLEIDSSLISCQDVHHGAFSPRDGILENQTWKSPK